MNKCNKCENENSESAKYCSNCGYELSKPIKNTTIVVPERKKKNTALWGTITGVALFFLVYFIMQQLFFKTPSFNDAMLKVASEINKSCPIMVDSETRLDNTITLPPNVFQYNYTLINIEKEIIDTLEMRKSIEPNIVNFVRTSPDMEYFRENKATVSYYYKDKNGKFLLRISVLPKQYE